MATKYVRPFYKYYSWKSTVAKKLFNEPNILTTMQQSSCISQTELYKIGALLLPTSNPTNKFKKTLFFALCFNYDLHSVTNLLLLYYSMGCRDLKGVWEVDEMWAGYNFILFYMSAIPYLIVMGTGWALQAMAPENQLILTVAIVTTIPNIFVTLYTCFTCMFLKLHSSEIRLKDRHIMHSWNCIKSFALIIQMLAGVIEVGGAVLFLLADYTGLSDSIRTIGHAAGLIGIMTSCCCFFLLPFSPDM